MLKWMWNILGIVLISMVLIGCGTVEHSVKVSKSPVVVTLWHSYNTNVKTVFDDMVEEFNETVGMERGIVVDTYGYGGSDVLETALYNSVNQMIGSEPMPHIFAAYPDSAYRIDKENPLVEMGEYFTQEEMEKYRGEFLEDGVWKENKTSKMIPVAKSTELLYVNKTDWDKFAKENNLSDEAFSTWEGLAEAAEKYYEWSDGKAMLGFNSFSDFTSLTSAQLGIRPYQVKSDGSVLFEYPIETARKIWDIFYVPHIKGWYKSAEYNQDGIKSGNLLAYIGSSAGASYFSKEVIIDETNQYPIECRVYSYPTFQGKNKIMGQRGANMCIASSDKEHEIAAAEFLKWFTKAEQNIKFAISTGYIPVTNEAIELAMKSVRSMDADEITIDGFRAATEAMNKDMFHTRTSFDGSYECNSIFNDSIFQKKEKDLLEMQIRINNGEEKESIYKELLSDENFNGWYEELVDEVSRK